MATVGEMVAKLRADTAPFQRGMGKASQSMTGLQKTAKVAGTAIKASLAAATAGIAAGLAGVGIAAVKIKGQFAEIDRIAKTSAKLGIDTEKLVGLELAAEKSGLSIETMSMSLQRMARRLSEAAVGSGEAQGALKELGLDAAALGRLSPDQQLAAIADAMKAVGSDSERLRLAFKLFDSEGVGMVNVLRDGSAGLREFQKEAERLGLTFSADMAAEIEKANDAVLAMKRSFDGIFRTLAIELAPVVKTIADSIKEFTLNNRTTVIDAMNDGIEGLLEGLDGVINAMQSIVAEAKSLKQLAGKGAIEAFGLAGGTGGGRAGRAARAITHGSSAAEFTPSNLAGQFRDFRQQLDRQRLINKAIAAGPAFKRPLAAPASGAGEVVQGGIFGAGLTMGLAQLGGVLAAAGIQRDDGQLSGAAEKGTSDAFRIIERARRSDTDQQKQQTDTLKRIEAILERNGPVELEPVVL